MITPRLYKIFYVYIKIENMELHIITPEGKEEHDGITEISMPTSMWVVTIRPGHVHLTTILVKGKIVRYNDAQVDSLESFKDQSKHMYIPWWVALFTDESLTIISSNIK